MKNVLLLATLVLLTLSAASQISYEERIELELKDGYDNENLFEFGQNGFILASKKGRRTNKNEWKFEKYDTNLKAVQSKSIELDRKLRLDEIYTDQERLHTLYKDRKGNFTLVSIGAADLKITKIEGAVPKKSYIKEMAVLGDYAYFNASIKRAPHIFSVNWKTGKKKLIPIAIKDIKPKRISLMNFQLLESSNEIFAYAKVYISKKESDIHCIRLDQQGQKKESFNLTKRIDKNIVDVSALKLSEGQYVYTGTYSTKFTGMSEGLFFCQTQNNKVDFIKYYSFLDLENFLSYLPERKQKRIEKKKKRKEKRGKELKFNYRISAHDLIRLDDGFLFLGEAYYPTYRTESYTTTSTVNGVTTTTTHTRQVFDGYRYTHAILGKFDHSGNLAWDEIFEMWPSYKPFYVKKFISIAEQNQSSLKLIFASWNKITSKSIDFDGKVLKESQSEEIKTNLTGDKTKRSFSNIDYWYNNYFIAYGRQKIKNTQNKVNAKRKRKVYFINKIKYTD